MEISFEVNKLENLYIVVEIINSNPQYNIIKNRRETRIENEIIGEFLHSNSFSLFVKADDTFSGIIDLLLIIYGDSHWFGFG